MVIKRINIEPTWLFRDETGHTLDPHLFRLLNEVYRHRKLTQAASECGLSYRHSWNLLNKWADFFGSPLVNLERGKGAQLTLLGEKLLWAEQRVMARLQPQMANLASELNLEIQKALENVTPLLRIQASHGYAVALLPDVCNNIQLNLQYSSPMEALTALNRDGCDLAGLHMPQDVVIPALFKRYKSVLKPRSYKVLRFITRQQGLMVRKDCDLSIESLHDLTNSKVRFINRQEDSGTRALFDQLLQDAKISSDAINGYSNREFTHSAVAAYVAANMADVGFGVSHAAHQFGLKFIPLCMEDYVFILHQKNVGKASVVEFIEQIQQPPFLDAVKGLAGYTAQCRGTLEDLSDWIQA